MELFCAIIIINMSEFLLPNYKNYKNSLKTKIQSGLQQWTIYGKECENSPILFLFPIRLFLLQDCYNRVPFTN